jgi:hypothetical protein
MRAVTTWHTASGWMNRGFIIKTGARSPMRNVNGVPLFCREQVRVRRPLYIAPRSYYREWWW